MAFMCVIIIILFQRIYCDVNREVFYVKKGDFDFQIKLGKIVNYVI
jgi:hypothetical protein